MAKRLFYTKFGWEDNSLLDIKRNIKLFALINTDLVIPSNHIYSEKAEIIFNKNPELLELNLIKTNGENPKSPKLRYSAT